MNSRISAIIIAYNEAANIADCLKSVAFADEIIFIDNESTDSTREIAKKFTKHVFSAERVGYVEPIRNYALTKATGDWILFLDADERIPETLAAKLRQIVEKDVCNAVEIPRRNIIFNKWIEHTGWWPDNILRFFKKDSISWPERIHVQPRVPEQTITLEPTQENAIIHYNYSSISQYLQKLDSYTTIQAGEINERNGTQHIATIISEPTQEFVSRFFAREGYKDGLHGLVLSLLQAVSSLIVVLKVWELQGFPKQENILPLVNVAGRKSGIEVRYWMATVQIQIQKNPIKKLYLKSKRRVKK